jgi:hypothetical protein
LTSLGTDQTAGEAYEALRASDVPDPRRRGMITKTTARIGRSGVPTFIGVSDSDDGLN